MSLVQEQTRIQVEQLQKNVVDIKNNNYYESNQSDVDSEKLHSINISHFENSSNFFFQRNDYFFEFDKVHDELQAFCEKANHVQYAQLKQERNLDSLAIAAKFEEDQLWYRARICTENPVNNDFLQFRKQVSKVLIEFIDYGNTQLTSIEDCVFLNPNLSKFKKCAYKCSGLSYLKSIRNSVKLDELSIENLLCYGKINPSETDIEKRNWNNVFFSKINNEHLLEIDEFYKIIHNLKLDDQSFYLNPSEYNENILRHAAQDEINVRKLPDRVSKGKQVESLELDVVATNCEAGLKYMYFNLSKATEKLKTLEKELDTEKADLLTSIPSSHLTIGCYYLLKHHERFYRVLLIAKNSNKLICHLIDYGGKACLQSNEADKCLYLLTPKYFKYNSFSFHCQLVFGYNIEKAWTDEEKSDFFKKIKAQSFLKIKLLTYDEPYMIEFIESQNFAFSFQKIIDRIKKDDFENWELEPQTVINGSNLWSSNEDFFLGGDFLKGNLIFSYYILSKKLNLIIYYIHI